MEMPAARPLLLPWAVKAAVLPRWWPPPPLEPAAVWFRPSKTMRLLWNGIRGARLTGMVQAFSVPLGYQLFSTTPFSVKKFSIRRGAADAVAARTRRGVMASRNGRAMATPPAPRRSARREIGALGIMAGLLCCEEG